jgi:hypothetical protein
MVLHPYLHHIGEPQRDDEIDGEERDGEGGKTETMYVCMYEWMDVYGWGEVLVLTSFAMVFLMHIYALQEFSHHGQTCEGQPIRQEDADGAQGSPTCSRRRSYRMHDHLQGSALLRDEGAGQVSNQTSKFAYSPSHIF